MIFTVDIKNLRTGEIRIQGIHAPDKLTAMRKQLRRKWIAEWLVQMSEETKNDSMWDTKSDIFRIRIRSDEDILR